VIEKFMNNVAGFRIAAHRFTTEQLCFFCHCEHRYSSLYAGTRGL
jgi:hypothetical protein